MVALCRGIGFVELPTVVQRRWGRKAGIRFKNEKAMTAAGLMLDPADSSNVARLQDAPATTNGKAKPVLKPAIPVAEPETLKFAEPLSDAGQLAPDESDVIGSHTDEEIEALREYIIKVKGVPGRLVFAEDGWIIDGRLRHRLATELKLEFDHETKVGLNDNERRIERYLANKQRANPPTEVQRKLVMTLYIQEHPNAISSRALTAMFGYGKSTIADHIKTMVDAGTITRTQSMGLDNKQRRMPKPKRGVKVTGHGAKNLEAIKKYLPIVTPTHSMGSNELRRLGKRIEAKQKMRERDEAGKVSPLPKHFRILNSPVAELANRAELKPDSIDLIITDAPWKNDQDGNGDIFRAWGELGALGAQCLKPGGLLVTCVGKRTLLPNCNQIAKHLEWVDILCQPFETTSATYSEYIAKTLSQWRPIVIFGKPPGAKKKVRLIDLLHPTPRERDRHKWQQPHGMFYYLIEALSEPGGFVVDPFVGGGTSAVAAWDVGGGRHYLGADIEPDAVRTSLVRLTEMMELMPYDTVKKK